jgi:hypothetical protein
VLDYIFAMENTKFKTHYTEFPVDGRTFSAFAKRHLLTFLIQCCGMTHQTSSLRVCLPLKLGTKFVRMSAVQQDRAAVVYCVLCIR